MLSQSMNTAPADVLILPMTDDLAPAIRLATTLRDNGIRVQLYSEKKKFKAKIGYADKLSIPYVIFMGEDEIAQGVCSVKEMATGSQQTVTAAEAAAMILAGLEAGKSGKVIVE